MRNLWFSLALPQNNTISSPENLKVLWAFCIPSEFNTNPTLAKKAVRKAGVHNGDSDKEAVRKISKWICKHTKYKAGTYDNSEAYTLFSKGTGVCRDYSDAFWAMCKICNIPCKYYTGQAKGGHGWNRVKVSGKWYWIDVTWMDGKTIKKKYYLKRRLWKNHKNAKPCTKSILCSRVKYYWEHP